jgi:hypothetical protein
MSKVIVKYLTLLIISRNRVCLNESINDYELRSVNLYIYIICVLLVYK